MTNTTFIQRFSTPNQQFNQSLVGHKYTNLLGYATSISWTKFMDMYALPDKKPFFNAFEPTVVSFIFVKNALIAINPNIVRLQEKLDSLSDEESENLELSKYFKPKCSNLEFNIWNGFVTAMKLSMLKDIVTLQINRVLEHFLLPQLSIKSAKALIKDMSKSSIRKHKRYGYSFTYAVTLFSSSLRSQLLFYTSVVIYNSSFEIFMLWREKDKENFQERAGIIVGYNLVQSGKGWFFTGVGGVIGGFISPGIGTVLGINIVPLIGVAVVDQLLLKPKKSVE